MVVSWVGLQISEAVGARRGTHYFGRSLECSGPSRGDLCKDQRPHGKLLVGRFKAGCYRYFH